MNCKETAGHGRSVLGTWKIPRHIKLLTESGLFLSCWNYLLGFANDYLRYSMGQMTPSGAEGTKQRFWGVLLGFLFVFFWFYFQ